MALLPRHAPGLPADPLLSGSPADPEAPAPPGAELVFPTRVDAWLVAVLALALGGALAALLLQARRDPGAGLFGVGILVAAVAVVSYLAYPTRYVLGRDELVIHSGVLRHYVPLAAIRRVHPTRNPISAPAWSLDRLGIEYARHGRAARALVSPARREEFLRVLAERAGLVAEGRELRRPGAE